MLENLKTDASVEAETDFIGGGVLDSALYDFVIDMAYFDKSAGGAANINLDFKAMNGARLKTVIYITSGNAKGNKNYYERDGKKHYLPGFNVANSISKLSIDKELSELVPETKTVKVYDFTKSKEVNQEKEVITELLGTEITCGVIKQLVDKNVKNSADIYVPSGDTREENEITKCFRASDGLTVPEIVAGETKPEFKEKWDKKHTGNTRNKAKGVRDPSLGATSPAPGGATAPATESLFDK